MIRTPLSGRFGKVRLDQLFHPVLDCGVHENFKTTIISHPRPYRAGPALLGIVAVYPMIEVEKPIVANHSHNTYMDFGV